MKKITEFFEKYYLSYVIGVACGLIYCLIIRDYSNTYRNGQIDALNGIIKYKIQIDTNTSVNIDTSYHLIQ